MSRTTACCALMCVAALLLVIVIVRPELISDKNTFLAGFVPHEFLPTAGVMLTITLASAGQVHLNLNQIEERHNRVSFERTHATVRSAAYWLIRLFIIALILVVIRPFAAGQEWAEALCNGAAIFLLFWMTLIMTDLTQLVFAIKPDIRED